nr:MAG TPA: hypothetical protein [Bacteriophage sp.]
MRGDIIFEKLINLVFKLFFCHNKYELEVFKLRLELDKKG